MTTQPMPREPHEGIKADAGAEAQAGDRDQTRRRPRRAEQRDGRHRLGAR